MYQQPFRTEELQAELERTLGFKLGPLVRIGGGGAINFKAERVSDGLKFVVKCFPLDRRESGERLLETLKTMEGVKTPVRLFAEALPAVLLDHLVFCLSWQEGEVIAPDRLTDEQWRAFLDDYRRFSERMRAVVTKDEVVPMGDLWRSARAACRGLAARILSPGLDVMREDELDFKKELTQTVHGDFHQGNLLFCDGGLRCFMDLESLRKGYPAEDICGLLMIAASRLGISDWNRRERLLSLFGQAVRQLPYSPQEWRTAINALIVKRLHRKTDGFVRMGMIVALDMASSMRLANLFRRRVDAEEKVN